MLHFAFALLRMFAQDIRTRLFPWPLSCMSKLFLLTALWRSSDICCLALCTDTCMLSYAAQWRPCAFRQHEVSVDSNSRQHCPAAACNDCRQDWSPSLPCLLCSANTFLWGLNEQCCSSQFEQAVSVLTILKVSRTLIPLATHVINIL